LDASDLLIKVMTDRLAIMDSYARYALAIDAADHGMLATVFDDETVFTPAGGLPSRRGLQANFERLIARRLGSAVRERHITSVPVVLEFAGEWARACSACVILATPSDGPPVCIATGRYDDTLVRRGPGWIFRTRLFTADKPQSEHREAP